MNALQIYNNLVEEEKYLKEKLLEFLQPLTEKYVSVVECGELIPQKFLLVFNYTHRKSMYRFKPLIIDIDVNEIDIIISITFIDQNYSANSSGKYSVSKEDFHNCIKTNNYNIESIKKIIVGIKKHAIPICWQTDEKRLYIEKVMDNISWITREKIKNIESNYFNS